MGSELHDGGSFSLQSRLFAGKLSASPASIADTVGPDKEAVVAGNREFDEERFQELVLYISWKTRADTRFGRTKLAKVLFYCDFAAYAEEEQSLTGALYEHWQHGPFPPCLYEAEEKIAASGQAEVTRFRSQDAGEELKILPYEEPKVRRFEEWEVWQRELVDSYTRKIADGPSWRVRKESHKHPGWLLTQDYEEIPYHSAFMSRRKPTARDLERGEQIAVELGW